MIEVRLKPKKDNYMFIDPSSGLHLTLIHNVGVVEQTTPFIENGVLSGVIEVIDTTPKEDVVETVSLSVEEAPAVEEEVQPCIEEEKPKTKKSKKKSE